MHAVVLASGFNIRMQEVCGGGSKAFLEIGGKYLIDWVVQSIPKGVPTWVTCNDAFSRQFQKWAEGYPEVRLFEEAVSSIDQSLGTMGSLNEFLEYNTIRGPLLVLGVDNFLEDPGPLREFLNHFKHLRQRRSREGGVTLIALESEVDPERWKLHGVAKLEPSGVVPDFVEKPQADPFPRSKLPRRWTSVMCYVFPPTVFPFIGNAHLMDMPPEGKMPRAGDFIQWLVKNGYDVRGHKFDGQWRRIVIPEDYFKVKEMYEGKEGPT